MNDLRLFCMAVVSFTLVYLLSGCSLFESDKPSPTPSPTPPQTAECGELLNTPSRGIATLHCLQNEARPQCQDIVQTVKDACIKNVALYYLVNGTFGRNLSHIQHDVFTISQEGRNLDLILYVYNGPGQRRCRSTSDNSWDVRMCPDTFRWAVQSNADTRNRVREDTQQLIPLIDFAKMAGATVHIIPMLEDNLNRPSFTTLAGLMKEVLPDDVRYGRNPCGGCYSGNDDVVPSGFFLDKHTGDPNRFSHSDGLVTNDGTDYEFPGEGSSYPRQIPFSVLRSARNKAGETGNIFVLWKAGAQGLTGGNLPPPSGRNYRAYSPSEKEILKGFLRGD